jgi:alkylation response protein AidB-like acyl-CoA dehydrogenase
MDLNDSPQEAAFRAEAIAWLDANAAGAGSTSRWDTRPIQDRLAEGRAWQRKLFEGGWAGITWPREYGGRGGTSMEATIFQEEESRRVSVLKPFNPAQGDAGPQIMTHGTPEQKEAHLLPILRGEQVWCHLLSEPGAGSDLAGLATRAVRDGDEFVVNGQKVWTSYAHYADYGLLLARTNPDVRKHQGLTYLILDMSSPGVTVRPLYDMTGVSNFNEVFFDDVRVPAVNVIGDVDKGWTVTRNTMVNERAYVAAGSATAHSFPGLVEIARRQGTTGDPVVRQRLASCYIRQELLRFLRYRLQTNLSQNRPPGPETAVMKLAGSTHGVLTANDAVELLGASGGLMPGSWQMQFLGSLAGKIGGGTDNMQKNMIGERILGLPRERNGDETVPWREIGAGR